MQTVSGHDQTVVKVSNRDLNRIVLPSKILKVYTSKSIEVKVEGSEAYVKVPPAVMGPIELYLLAEGETYTLMLLPTPVPAETIVIKGSAPARPGLEADTYIRQIKALLRAIAGGAVPAGYDVSLIPDGKEACPVTECSLVAVRRYAGMRLAVIEYRLSNPTKEPRIYKEQLFVRPGARAVALEQHRVEPGGATRLLVVEEVGP